MPYGSTKKNATLAKTYPDITLIVRGLLKEQRVTQRKLAKMLGWNHSTINQMLKRRTWNIAELLEVGKALQTDLLKYYYPVPPQPMVPGAELEAARQQIQQLQNELTLKEAELLKLRTEKNVLREVFGNAHNRTGV